MGTFDPGSVVGDKYLVLRELGSGGMGVVVAARNRALGNVVAIKYLRPTVRADAAACQRFLQEARLVTRLESQHVARVHDMGTADDGTPFIVMEHLYGRTVAAELARRGPLPVEEAVDLLLQACEAIAEAHNIGIVHRDLKPANLFVTTGPDQRPLVKVLDFGISKSLLEGDASVTASHVAMGSPLYMSPEQLANSKDVDARTDVWALGVILYEMLTGKTPFPGETVAMVGAAVMAERYARLAEVRKEVPGEIDRVVHEALTKDRDKRLASVEAFAKGIAPFGSEAARVLVERIERIAKRVAPAAEKEEEGGSGAEAGAGTEAHGTTEVVGPPSEVSAAQGEMAATKVPANVRATGEAPRKEAPAPPPPERAPSPARGKRPGIVTVGAIGAVVVATGAAIFFAVRSNESSLPVSQVNVPADASVQPPTSAAPSSSSAPVTPPVPVDASSAEPVCPLDPADQEGCHKCRNEKCCKALLACEASSTCPQYKKCVAACNTKACKVSCARRNTDGHKLAAPLLACAQVRCYGTCATVTDACTDCLVAKCPDETEACLSDPECDLLADCAALCGMDDQACLDRCTTGAASAPAKKVKAYWYCGQDVCRKACRR